MASVNLEEDQKRRRNRLARLKEGSVPYLFISPFVISFLIFMVFPSLYTIILSLCEYQGYGGARFVGLLNYQRLLNYQDFWATISNTLIYLAASSIPVMTASFLLAVAIYS